jgi:D-alanine-D-alanine ligase
VALVFGGRSSEHSISCVSAAFVWRALEDAGFKVVPLAISQGGAWQVYPGDHVQLASAPLPSIEELADSVSLELGSGGPYFIVNGQVKRVDVVFPLLHGPWGEDGTIQGLCEIAGVPYVGSGVLAAAAAMDKITMKRLLESAGIPVGKWQAASEEHITLAPPLFIKPSRAGSSRGITRVSTEGEIAAALIEARAHDPRIIVESAFVGAREIECGVLQRANGMLQSSRCAEIMVRAGHTYYDFDAKYQDDSTELVVPAVLEPELEERIQNIAKDAFVALGCEGLARVDFFIVGEEIYVNEVNTMPGFTSISLYPRMFEASGVSYADLVQALVSEALSRSEGLR